jgi:universal stress protein A
MKNDPSTVVHTGGLPTTSSTSFRLTHILAPTDFSDHSERAVNYAVNLAQRVGARLTLVHIVPEVSALDYTMGGISGPDVEGWREAAKKMLADHVAGAKQAGAEVESVLGTALHAHEGILDIAKQISADLIVLSTHGYTGWKHFLFGHKAEKIVQHAPCPVLIVL